MNQATPESLLELCWHRGTAHRLAVLVDGSNYFAALREAMLAARNSIRILGWDIDSRTRLIGVEIPPPDGAPESLREFLEELVTRTPGLEIKLLLWDYSVFYAAEREILPQVSLGWRTPDGIDICLDGELPVEASCHQKVVVIDDCLAFVGGLDLTVRRWDTPEHKPDDSRRVDPGGEPYAPFHDLHAVVDGEPARAVARFCRQRWELATSEQLPLTSTDRDLWPTSVTPQFTDTEVGIARTIAPYRDQSQVSEIREIYLAAIQQAESFIYIENQYITAECIAETLMERLQQNIQLEVLCVCPRAPGGWLEAKAMGAARERFMARISAAGLDDRVRFVEPRVGASDDDLPINVHAKLMIVDDRILLLGSANLNNRSLGLDTECNLVLDCAERSRREALAGIRDALIAEHTGASAREVSRRLVRGDRRLDSLLELDSGQRRFSRIEAESKLDDEFARSITKIADPEAPLDPSDFLGDSFDGREVSMLRRRAVWIGSGVLLLAALLAAWNFTPLSQLVDAEVIAAQMTGSRNSFSAALIMVGLFVAGGFLFFPVTVLITASGMILGPALGFATAVSGVMLSAAASFLAGNKLESLLGAIIPKAARRKIDTVLQTKGIMTVAVIRNIPVAPFAVVNLLAGHTGIGLTPFLVGTLLGMAPGIAMLSLMGDRVRAIWANPTPGNLGWLLTAIVAWVAVAILLQRLANRFKSHKSVRDAD
jgi:phospholipase D1/2